MKKFLLIALSIIPSLALAQITPSSLKAAIALVQNSSEAEANNSEHIVSMIIKPGEDVVQGGNSGFVSYEQNQKNLRKSRDDNRYSEIRVDAGIYQGIGDLLDKNANLKVGYIYHFESGYGIGMETGYYHSATKYGCKFLPITVNGSYNFENINGFVPFIEAYTGMLIGIGRSTKDIDGDTSIPNCVVFGGKMGIQFTIFKKFILGLAVDYYSLTNNGNKTYSDTSVSCLGPSGSLSYKF